MEITGEIYYEGFQARYHLASQSGQPSCPTRPVILFLGGAFQPRNSWAALARSFDRQASALTLDLPGTIDYELTSSTFGFAWFATFVVHVLDLLDIKKIHIVSASYGTGLAYCLASIYSERVERLVLIGAVKELDQNGRSVITKTAELLKHGDVKEAARYGCFLALQNLDPRLKIKRQEQVLKVVYRYLSRLSEIESERYIANTERILNFKQTIESLPIPHCAVLGFTGEHDTLTTPTLCRSFLQTLPNATFTLIKNADHLAILEDPQTVSELIEQFFFLEMSERSQQHTCRQYENVGYLNSRRLNDHAIGCTQHQKAVASVSV